jgi:hypothetical protein
MERAVAYAPGKTAIANYHRPIGKPGVDKPARQRVGRTMP